MNKEHKKSLFVRGALRGILTVGGVAGLSAIFPMASPFIFIGGCGVYCTSMKLTAKKMEQMENWDPTYEPKIINRSAYYAGKEDPIYDVYEPEENVFEAHESIVVNQIIDKTSKVVNCVADKLGIKKSKLDILREKRLLKQQEREKREEAGFEQIH